MKLHLITFATHDFVPQAEALSSSALAAGFDHSTVLGPEDLSGSDFAKRNKFILEQKRGGGFWLWKPYVIRRALESLQPDDALLYSDAGRTPYYSFTGYPKNLVTLLNNSSPGFLLGPVVPHLGMIGNWTKRDCLTLMDADTDLIRGKPLLMTWSLWKPTNAAFEFLDKWQGYAEDPCCLTDMDNIMGKPNYPGFRDHRHDQSIMSILAHKLGAPFVDLTGTLTHRLLAARPGSELAHTFYKRPQNVEDVLSGSTPLILVREHSRLRQYR